MDLPYGKGSKIATYEKAKEMGEKFVWLGNEIDMKVKYLLTDGTQPIGNGVGPILEARDLLRALNCEGPKDLIDKSIMMMGELLEFCGSAEKKQGARQAKDILESGKAMEKMRQIIKLQRGNPNVRVQDLKPGKFKKEVKAASGGKVMWIENSVIAMIARTAGSPQDPGAGLYVEKKVGEKVSAGEVLFTVYAENQMKLKYALDIAKKTPPFTVE